ncbi:MAG: hypothetical protein AB7P69_04205 [Candidatus Binatia bacterium]
MSLEKPEETGLALRTANLFSFRRQNLPLLVKPLSYQGKEGVWVAAIAFRIVGSRNDSFEGAIYLNPWSAYDLPLLQHLTKQDCFPVLFFSPTLRVAVSQAVEWTVHQRQELRVMLAQAAYACLDDAISKRETDPDFERARQEFEKVYSIEKLLTLQTAGTARVSSPFRGAVLD